MTRPLPALIPYLLAGSLFIQAAHASSVIVSLDADGAFILLDRTGTVERLRLEEATGNLYRNGSLFLHSTGTFNTAVGAQAMGSVTAGVHNAAFGDSALAANTTGANNTAIGHYALTNAGNANENTVLGSDGLAAITASSGNTGVGSRVLKNATGANNIAIGVAAGIELEEGNDNIYLGHAGVSSESGSIRIGTPGLQNQAYMAGVFDTPVTGQFVVVDAEGRLGSTTVAPGGGSAVVLLPAGAFVVRNNTQTIDRLRIDEANGNLSRNGSLLLHDAGQSTNLFMGAGAGNPATTAGFNSAFGPGALSAVSTGISNAAFGTRALRLNTVGQGNTALGTESLENNTTGSSNIGVGRFALRANLTGANNVGVGVSASASNTTGSFNTAVGNQALFTNLTGQSNTALGDHALFDHTGTGTTAIGAGALENNLTAPNTALGFLALQGNRHGVRMTAIGYEALKNISGGGPGGPDTGPSPGDNTAVGYQALLDVGSHGGNTAVGSQSILHFAGSGNTALGALAIRGADGATVNAQSGDNTAVGASAMSLAANLFRRNVAVGSNALERIGNNGSTNNVGTQNIALGWRAGWNLRVGSNNVYIGNEGPASESGQIRIGTDGVHLQQHLAGDVRVEKSLSVTTLTIRGGADIAEPFDIHASTPVLPGMVVSIDPERPGGLRLSSGAYDHTVVGIVSGAGGVRPGIMLTQTGSIADGAHPVAMSGRVYALTDEAEGGDIRPGDLLTSAARPGYAMRVGDGSRAPGAVLGKAMTARDPASGLVLVLVTLQ